MRIIAGKYRGLKLAEVGDGDSAAHLRPTTDRVRENLFNMLSSRLSFANLRVLDLFAGTGALGFEALSRGASYVCFVDDGARARKLLKANAALTKSSEVTRILRQNATTLPPNPEPPFDLVFMDPPYGQNLGNTALDIAQKTGWLASNAWVVWEEQSAQPTPPGFSLIDRRAYGKSHITLLELSS